MACLRAESFLAVAHSALLRSIVNMQMSDCANAPIPAVYCSLESSVIPVSRTKIFSVHITVKATVRQMMRSFICCTSLLSSKSMRVSLRARISLQSKFANRLQHRPPSRPRNLFPVGTSSTSCSCRSCILILFSFKSLALARSDGVEE